MNTASQQANINFANAETAGVYVLASFLLCAIVMVPVMRVAWRLWCRRWQEQQRREARVWGRAVRKARVI